MKIKALCFGKLSNPQQLLFWLLDEDDEKRGEMHIKVDKTEFDRFEIGKTYEFTTPPLRHEMAILKGEIDEEHY